MNTNRFFPLLTAVLLGTASLPARTWTASDGRSLEGEYVSATPTAVTIKRSDGRNFTIDLAKLSAADQEFVKEQSAKAKPAEPDAKKGTPVAITGEWAAHITGEWKQIEGKGGLKCMFFASKDLDASQKYPVMVYLHGKGNDVLGKKHLGFADACSRPANYKERPCFILAPQCPDENGWWGNTGENLAKTLTDLTKNLPVDKDRLYLVGFSMGGYGTFNWLNQEPKLFAAGVPVAGGCDVSIARNLRKIPLWVFHGEKDEVVPPKGSREVVKALEKLKAPVKYTEFPGEGHNIFGKVTENPELHAWLFAQKRI